MKRIDVIDGVDKFSVEYEGSLIEFDTSVLAIDSIDEIKKSAALLAFVTAVAAAANETCERKYAEYKQWAAEYTLQKVKEEAKLPQWQAQLLAEASPSYVKYKFEVAALERVRDRVEGYLEALRSKARDLRVMQSPSKTQDEAEERGESEGEQRRSVKEKVKKSRHRLLALGKDLD